MKVTAKDKIHPAFPQSITEKTAELCFQLQVVAAREFSLAQNGAQILLVVKII